MKIPRRHFLRSLTVGAALAPALSFAANFDRLRGDRVGWARLKTPSTQWRRHAGSDPILTNFFRDQTTLNIDPIWYVADADNLQQLCTYPFLFSQDVSAILAPLGRVNLAEYIRRGGFVLVDACHDRGVTPDFDAFLQHQIEFYSLVLPEAKVISLPSTHDVYRCHFQIPGGKPPHTFAGNVYDPQKARHGLYGIMIGLRMAGIVSLCSWQCGWDHVTEHGMSTPAGLDVSCMQMVVNIYIYAMTQGA